MLVPRLFVAKLWLKICANLFARQVTEWPVPSHNLQRPSRPNHLLRFNFLSFSTREGQHEERDVPDVKIPWIYYLICKIMLFLISHRHIFGKIYQGDGDSGQTRFPLNGQQERSEKTLTVVSLSTISICLPFLRIPSQYESTLSNSVMANSILTVTDLRQVYGYLIDFNFN